HPNLNLNTEEQRVYGQLLKEADPDGFGAVSGDVAVRFFERTKLPPDVLGQIWQIADTENRGFLTPAGFGVALRLIGHAQAGRSPSAQIAPQAAPLPRFDNAALAEQPHSPTGAPASPTAIAPPPIRVPALTPDKVAEYSGLFEKSGAENGYLPGLIAKQIFERARLPNEVLGRIWALSDTQGRGSLNVTEFVIAMHLLASYKSGQMRGVPNTLPPGLYDAANRRPPVRMGSNSRPGSSALSAVPPQLTGFTARPQSPVTRQQVSTPLSAQSTGDGWVVAPADKARFDSIFSTVDRQGLGYITGEQAVEFFGNARLPEEVLAQIWDLADINSEGRLNKDEFAVAMYLIRQQRGTKDGRGNLPSTLPPALIPPSMRKQQAPPSQPTAPSFENAPVTKPRSAADDLFGLDAFGPAPSAPAPVPAPAQAPQSTGGTDAGPFANPPGSYPSALSPQTTSTTFKPFIPSSSFGQSIIPQSTGSPAPQARSLPAPNDDLLGDADPEISSKLTNETSELGNLSNQVSTLSNQTTELQGTRKQTEQELSNVTAQKRAFEGRLAQLRSLYEKEVQEVKALQEQLTTSKNETKRLQQDMAMIDGTHQDLSTQHQQLRAQLENDQRENASLKERIRQTNQETELLRPQLEKLRSDARQQKGLVAINKKQLATNEVERDRIKAEIAAAQKQVEDAQKEAEDPPTVASPAPSTSSNPFFRRTTETPTSPPVSREETKDHHSAFDNIFGPSFGAAAAPAPSVSFTGQSSVPSSSSNATLEESTAASSTPRDTAEPPAPPQSRQLTSAALPFRRPLGREDSISSSVQVAPPASRLSPSDTPRALTPTTSTSSPDIPGAFPSTSGAQTPAQGLNPTAANEVRDGSNAHGTNHEESSANAGQTFDEYFGGPSHQRTASQKAADFDSAFAGMSQSMAVNGEQSNAGKEFPDIQEYVEDDSSDYSESTPMKFEDDFNTRSPPQPTAPDATTRTGKQPEVIEPHDDVASTRPPLGAMSSTATSLPGVDQQKSPPSYGEVVPEDNPSHFPPEFKGLLPEREDPTSPTPTAGGSTHPASPPMGNPPAYGPEAQARSASDGQAATAPPPTKAAPFDFDSAFSGMGSAPVEDDNEDEEEGEVFTPAKNAADFDPTFDSPPQTKPSTAPHASAYASVTNGTPGPVGETLFGSNGTAPTNSYAGPASPVPAVSHDWDALFAPLNTSTDSPSVQSSAQPVQDTRPELGRALSTGTEHDDPILKRLTAMGWTREESLDALEKFDYNIDKVRCPQK
ncbi:hypothetical protein EDD37DRAFT_571101, partial [Exophiala viscosa]|uniref:uncharacterized protein n=1 Tax=Exophiala viscosa TaxID=2486360 RepID=UPI0021973813